MAAWKAGNWAVEKEKKVVFAMDGWTAQ